MIYIEHYTAHANIIIYCRVQDAGLQEDLTNQIPLALVANLIRLLWRGGNIHWVQK